jgi:hypothetical protein
MRNQVGSSSPQAGPSPTVVEPGGPTGSTPDFPGTEDPRDGGLGLSPVPVMEPEIEGLGCWMGSSACLVSVNREVTALTQAASPHRRPGRHRPLWITVPVDPDALLAANMAGGALTTTDLRTFPDLRIRRWALADLLSVGARAAREEMCSRRFADGYRDDPQDGAHFALLTERVTRAFSADGDPR